MSKQQEIREGLIKFKCGCGNPVSLENCEACCYYIEETNYCKVADPLIIWLHSQGVLIKIEQTDQPVEILTKIMREAGYTLTESLIEEEP